MVRIIGNRLPTLQTLMALLLAVAIIPCADAFQLPNNSILSSASVSSSSTSLGMAPKFDKSTQKWYPTDPETDGPSAGYGILGSLYRAGPVPVFQRIFNGDTYEQSVLKYMATEGCDRIEAQGNMDAYLENPADWQYQKMCEKNKGVPKRDYANANMEPKQIILSSAWAVLVFVFGYDLVTGVADGRYPIVTLF